MSFSSNEAVTLWALFRQKSIQSLASFALITFVGVYLVIIGKFPSLSHRMLWFWWIELVKWASLPIKVSNGSKDNNATTFDRIGSRVLLKLDFLVQIYPHLIFIPAARLSNFYIDVSNNTDGSLALRCAYEPNPFSPSETRACTCLHRLYGRYVRIRFASNKTQHLQLCEVQIQNAGQFITLPHLFLKDN